MPATAFDRLAPDQRAAVELVLRQGRSYGELSELLGMPEETIRARARSGLAALAPDLPAPSRSGEIADWLLGQQSEAHAARTRALLLEDPAAHRWAAQVAAPLREVPGGASVPELPTSPDAKKSRVNGTSNRSNRADKIHRIAEELGVDPELVGVVGKGIRDEEATKDAVRAYLAKHAPTTETPSGSEPTNSRRTAARDDDWPAADDEAPARGSSSRLGGALLIGVAVVIVAVVLAFVFTRGGDAPETAAAPPTPTATPAMTAVGSNQIALRGPAGSTSIGLMELFRANDDTVRFAIAAQGVAPNAEGERYSIWLTRDDGAPQLLGDVRDAVGENGQLTAAGPGNDQTDEFLEWLQSYQRIAITLDEKGAKEPGKVILSGDLPTTG